MSKQDGSGREVTSEPTDDVTATILHIDMDAFFASVELLERPDLAGKPVIVGHRSSRSVVTAATYEARKYGVNSAMPMSIALRRCPQAIVLEPHFERYTHYSSQVMGLLRDVTPLVEPLSIDEAFLDVAGALRLMGTPWQIGTRLRERVFSETGLHASIGAASTKYVAKLASSRAKPDGLLVVPAASTLEFLHPQPVSAHPDTAASIFRQSPHFSARQRDARVQHDCAIGVEYLESDARRYQEPGWRNGDRVVDLERVLRVEFDADKAR